MRSLASHLKFNSDDAAWRSGKKEKNTFRVAAVAAYGERANGRKASGAKIRLETIERAQISVGSNLGPKALMH